MLFGSLLYSEATDLTDGFMLTIPSVKEAD
jgi:hypothetical protein